MGQAVSSNNPLDYKFDFSRPLFKSADLQKLQTIELESIENLRIYTDNNFDDQTFSFENIDCS